MLTLLFVVIRICLEVASLTNRDAGNLGEPGGGNAGSGEAGTKLKRVENKTVNASTQHEARGFGLRVSGFGMG